MAYVLDDSGVASCSLTMLRCGRGCFLKIVAIANTLFLVIARFPPRKQYSILVLSDHVDVDPEVLTRPSSPTRIHPTHELAKAIPVSNDVDFAVIELG